MPYTKQFTVSLIWLLFSALFSMAMSDTGCRFWLASEEASNEQFSPNHYASLCAARACGLDDLVNSSSSPWFCFSFRRAVKAKGTLAFGGEFVISLTMGGVRAAGVYGLVV